MDTRERIFELLDEKKIEQKALAAALGVSEDIVSDWKRGKLKSFRKYLPEIAQALGTTSEYLLTGEENSPPALADELYRRFQRLTPENAQRMLGYLDSIEDHQEKP